MKRLLAPLALLPLFAIFNFTACSDDGSSAATTGGDPTLAICQHAPLCDPIVLPTSCAAFGASIDCSGPDGGAGDAGDGDAGDGGTASDAGDGGTAGGDHLSPLQAERLQCTLEALRDHREGGLTVLAAYEGSKTCGTRIEIVSFGDGSVSVLPVSYCDGDVVRGEAVRRKLQPASFFEECLASADEKTRLECLSGAVTTKNVSGGVCSCRGIAADPVRGPCHEE